MFARPMLGRDICESCADSAPYWPCLAGTSVSRAPIARHIGRGGGGILGPLESTGHSAPFYRRRHRRHACICMYMHVYAWVLRAEQPPPAPYPPPDQSAGAIGAYPRIHRCAYGCGGCICICLRLWGLTGSQAYRLLIGGHAPLYERLVLLAGRPPTHRVDIGELAAALRR